MLSVFIEQQPTSMTCVLFAQVCQGELPVGSTGLPGSANLFGAGAFTQDGQCQRTQVCMQVCCIELFATAINACTVCTLMCSSL